jgi:hypothetical protein
MIKNFKAFTAKGLVAIVLLGLLSVPALAAYAVTLDLSRASGYSGNSVTISGTAGAGQWVSIKAVDENGNIVYFSAVICDSAGDYSDSWVVPNVQPGALQIIAGYGSTVISETFTVMQRTHYEKNGEPITISDTEGNTANGTRTYTENGAKVDVPRDGFDKLAGKGDGNVTIDFGIVSVTFSGKAMDSISGSTDGGCISLIVEQVGSSTLSSEAQAKIGGRPVFDFTLMAGDTQISDFDGKAAVSVPYTLQNGENPRAVVIYCIDDSGNLKTVRGKYNAETGTVDFTATHFSVYAVGYHKVNFSDVADAAWYYDAVAFCAAREITTGTGNGLFSPGDTLTRGQFITMLMRAYGIEADVVITDNFNDAGNTYYTGYLAAAKRLGISNGIGNNMFAPSAEITRQDMFTLLYRALNVLEELPEGEDAATLSSFGDAYMISEYAEEAIRTFAEAGIISGDGENLDPLGGSTRAQMAQVLYNLLSR